jgi:hypothetical protein
MNSAIYYIIHHKFQNCFNATAIAWNLDWFQKKRDTISFIPGRDHYKNYQETQQATDRLKVERNKRLNMGYYT